MKLRSRAHKSVLEDEVRENEEGETLKVFEIDLREMLFDTGNRSVAVTKSRKTGPLRPRVWDWRITTVKESLTSLTSLVFINASSGK